MNRICRADAGDWLSVGCASSVHETSEGDAAQSSSKNDDAAEQAYKAFTVGALDRAAVDDPPDALVGGLIRNDAGHEEPDSPLHLGVQVAFHSDDTVGLPVAEPAPVDGLRRAFGDGHASGDREARRPPAATPAAPSVPSRPVPCSRFLDSMARCWRSLRFS